MSSNIMNVKDVKPNLRPLWDSLLEIYEVFSEICERQGLRFCADSGTTLGAVRHGGFIPWDDDMDIQMPRPDYERFRGIVKRELPAGYAWLDRYNCRDFKLAFGKVILTDETKLNKVVKESHLPLREGIFIDIFPLDGYPDSRFGILWRHFQNRFIRMLGASNRSWSKTLPLKVKRSWILGRIIRPFLPRHLQMLKEEDRVDFYERRAKKIPFGATSLCASVGLSTSYDDKPFHIKYFGTPKVVAFENTTMKIQEDADGYLKSYFGDYMKLPPEDCRIPSHALNNNVSWRLGPKEHD